MTNKETTKEEIDIFKVQCRKTLNHIEEVLNKKFLSYGKDSLLVLGETGIADTIKMKVIRLLNILNGGIALEDNSVEDSWRDLTGWSALGLMTHWKIYPGLPLASIETKKEQKIRLVYLAGPIDLITQEESRRWREMVTKSLNEHNICTFSPAHAFSWVGDASGAQKVIDINYVALGKSDALFLYLPDGIQTIGSLIELKIASDMKKPIVICTKIEKSLYLESFIKEPKLTGAIERMIALND